jgi:hypothetical protein
MFTKLKIINFKNDLTMYKKTYVHVHFTKREICEFEVCPLR